MSNRESATLSREQEERLIEALGLIVEAEPASVLTPHRDTPFWRRPIVVPALAFLAVLAVFLPFRLADNAQNNTPANSGTVQETQEPRGATGFSPGAAEEMDVAAAEYPFDVDEWSASREDATQSMAELGEEEVTVQLVDLVKDSASDVLAGIDAAPPYEATIVSAFQTDGAWNVLATATFADGECLVVVDRGSLGFHECRASGSNTPDPVMFDGDYGGFTFLSQDVSFVVGDWVSVMWWGLPQEASAVRYRTTSQAATSDDSVTPVLGGMIRISLEVQGVDQQFSIEALGTNDQTLLEDSIPIPAFGESGDVLVGTATPIEYETDATSFEVLVGPEDTFLGGGYVNGDPWAIVGRSLVAEGKPTLECSGVRPIIDEDVCDDLDGLGWMALPIGETGGGVLVIRSSQDADYVRINYQDGTASEAAFVGPAGGFPPVAVIPIEAPGASGTMHAITDNGDVLWSQPFTVTEIVNPGG